MGYHHVLAFCFGLAATVQLIRGIANLRGKALGTKSTARVQEKDLPAWRRIQAFSSFVLAALFVALSIVYLVGGGNDGVAGSFVSQRVLVCLIGVAVINLGIVAYAQWRYASGRE